MAQDENRKSGYIKLYRSILENGWIRNHKLWVFWSYCLLKATHKDHKVMVGNQQIVLQPGQFVFGLEKASKETGLSVQSIRTCIYNLKTFQNLTIKSTNKFSIVTVVNWAFYQGNDSEITSKITHNQQTGNNIQEQNNVENNNKAYELAELLASLIVKNNPSCRYLSNGNYVSTVKRWSKDIDKIIRLDQRPLNEIGEVIRWCQDDSFWSLNILSGIKLRQHYDRLEMQMRKNKPYKEARLADQYKEL